jgi:hypothetical protein
MKQFQLAFKIDDNAQPMYVGNILLHVVYRIERGELQGSVHNGEGQTIGTYAIVKEER